MIDIKEEIKVLWGKKSSAGDQKWLPLVMHLADTAAIGALLWDRWLCKGAKCNIAENSKFACDELSENEKPKMAKVSLRDFLESPKRQNQDIEIFSKAQNGKSQLARFARKYKMAKVSLRDFLESTKWQKSACEIFSKAQNGNIQISRFSRKPNLSAQLFDNGISLAVSTQSIIRQIHIAPKRDATSQIWSSCRIGQ